MTLPLVVHVTAAQHEGVNEGEAWHHLDMECVLHEQQLSILRD